MPPRRHPFRWLSARPRCVSGQRLRPLPTTGAHRLRLSRSRPLASASSYPKLPVLRPRRFGAAPYQGLCGRNPHRTGTSPSRRGERYHHTHSGLHPTSREQTLIRPSGVMRVPSSAPQPAAAPLHPPHPSPSTRPPSSGSRASLFVFRDPVQTHLRHSTLTGSPAATVSERGRCFLRPHPPRCRAGRQAVPHRSSPDIGTVSGSAVHRPSDQNGRAAAHATAPPHRPVSSTHSPGLYIKNMLLTQRVYLICSYICI